LAVAQAKKSKRKWDRWPQGNITNVMGRESDRACVLVAAAFIEVRLEVLLSVQFGKDGVSNEELDLLLSPKNRTALLGSGWAKATIARLFHLIDDELFRGYDALRDLRNEFAHHPATVVLDDDAAEFVAGTIKSNGGIASLKFNSTAKRWRDGGWKVRFTPARRRFMAACVHLDLGIIEATQRASGLTPDQMWAALRENASARNQSQSERGRKNKQRSEKQQ
jgi:hypothetical protein